MEVWKIIFLSKWVICRFHVNLPGCNGISLVGFDHCSTDHPNFTHPPSDRRWDHPQGSMIGSITARLFTLRGVKEMATWSKKKLDIHPRNRTDWYQKWPRLKGVIFSKPSFWVSMLVFGGVWIFGWLVLSDEQMSKGWLFFLLNDEQMSNWLGPCKAVLGVGVPLHKPY